MDVDFYVRLLTAAPDMLAERDVSVVSTMHPAQITARTDTRAAHLRELHLLRDDGRWRLSPWQVRVVIAYATLRRRLGG